jgi:hypothetical protein
MMELHLAKFKVPLLKVVVVVLRVEVLLLRAGAGALLFGEPKVVDLWVILLHL